MSRELYQGLRSLGITTVEGCHRLILEVTVGTKSIFKSNSRQGHWEEKGCSRSYRIRSEGCGMDLLFFTDVKKMGKIAKSTSTLSVWWDQGSQGHIKQTSGVRKLDMQMVFLVLSVLCFCDA